VGDGIDPEDLPALEALSPKELERRWKLASPGA
jgi:hypothetical protein